MTGETWAGGADSSGSAGGESPFEPDDAQPEPQAERPERAATAPESSDAVEQQLARSLDQLQRLQAEFDNYRKRTAREREEWQSRAQAELVRRLLPILDDLDRAKGHVAPAEATGALGGLLLILKRLEETLSAAGLERNQDAPGAAFDPAKHEAIQSVPSVQIEEGHLVNVFDAGYSFNGQVLRPSKVSVSAGGGD